MFLEFFDNDPNRLSRTEYKIRDEFNHIRHIHLCKPVLESGFPLTKVAQKRKRLNEFVSLIVLRSGVQLQSLRQFQF